MPSRTLHRRRLLSLASVSAGGVLAGCTEFRQQTGLDSRERRGDGEHHLIFEDDGKQVFTVSAAYREFDRERDRFPLELTTSQARRVELDRLRFELQVLNDDANRDDQFALVATGTAYEGLQFYQDSDDHGTAIVDFPSVDFPGSIVLEFLVDSRLADELLSITVDAELVPHDGFAERYLAIDSMRFDPSSREE